MLRSVFIIISVLFVLSFPPVGRSAEVKHSPVQAKLLADVSALKPGARFELAVLFEMDPHWHIYWKNPGDSGLPTSVDFELPEGFEAGGIGWPVPSQLKGAGGTNDYGYEGTLLLSAGIRAPSDLKPGSTVTLGARVSWVSCSDICIPGRTELQLKLPVSDKPGRVNTALFTSWRARLPASYSDSGLPFKITAKTVKKNENESAVSILLYSASSLRGIDLYPVPGNSYVVDNIVVGGNKAGGKPYRINFDVRKLKTETAAPDEIETLIVYTNNAGKRSGVVFPVDIEHDE
jgi:DsbC/DsbD-like thiol-disulfide interchange protein